jgi:hypothetical protein
MRDDPRETPSCCASPLTLTTHSRCALGPVVGSDHHAVLATNAPVSLLIFGCPHRRSRSSASMNQRLHLKWGEEISPFRASLEPL